MFRAARFHLSLLLALPMAAHSATFCVSNGVALQDAFTTARNNGASDVIRIVRGTHTSNVQAPQNYQWRFEGLSEADLSQSLEISGGWNAGCTVQETLDPSQTVLDAQYFGPVMIIQFGIDFSGSFRMSNVTLTRGRAFSSGQSAVIEARVLAAVGATAYFENLLLVAANSTASNTRIADVLMADSGILRVRNVIAHDNVHTGSQSSGIAVRLTGNAVGFISNNSLFSNSVTTRESGLMVSGTATVSNNAIGGNTTTDSQNMQFYGATPESLTLRNNHFETRGWPGFPASEQGTTTGDPMWTQTGSLMIPNASSPLRDSGQNSPGGGLLAIDFRGQTRIKNAVVDRGAVEADPPPAVGPQILASSPANNSTTSLVGSQGALGTSSAITFQTTGGTGAGSTQLDCSVTTGTISIASGGNQTVAVGAAAQPVQLSVPFASNGEVTQSQVLCQITRQNASGSTLNYTYRAARLGVFANGFE
jgi:hypothetical protein